MNVGAPACGMNAAIRSFVRVALSRGYNVLGIRYGFEGLVQDNVSTNSAMKLVIRPVNTLYSILLGAGEKTLSV